MAAEAMNILTLAQQTKELAEKATPPPGRCRICGEMMPRGEEMFKLASQLADAAIEMVEMLIEIRDRTVDGSDAWDRARRVLTKLGVTEGE